MFLFEWSRFWSSTASDFLILVCPYSLCTYLLRAYLQNFRSLYIILVSIDACCVRVRLPSSGFQYSWNLIRDCKILCKSKSRWFISRFYAIRRSLQNRSTIPPCSLDPMPHCRCQQYGAFSMKALARYQIILLGEQRHIRCEQLAQGCCPNNAVVGVEPATSWSRVQRPTATLPTVCRPMWIRACVCMSVTGIITLVKIRFEKKHLWRIFRFAAAVSMEICLYNIRHKSTCNFFRVW